MKTITYDENRWKLVPLEPTPEMVRAGYERTGTYLREVRETYEIMLEVAPASECEEF